MTVPVCWQQPGQPGTLECCGLISQRDVISVSERSSLLRSARRSPPDGYAKRQCVILRSLLGLGGPGNSAFQAESGRVFSGHPGPAATKAFETS